MKATSWSKWGKKVSLNQARRGDVVVVRTRYGHHVGFYAGRDGNKVQLLGGNQSNQVKRDSEHFSLWVKTSEKDFKELNLHVRNSFEVLSIFNVVGELTGSVSPEKYWAFSAHYDHIGIRPTVDGDSTTVSTRLRENYFI